jgi:hypothetical protein
MQPSAFPNPDLTASHIAPAIRAPLLADAAARGLAQRLITHRL